MGAASLNKTWELHSCKSNVNFKCWIFAFGILNICQSSLSVSEGYLV